MVHGSGSSGDPRFSVRTTRRNGEIRLHLAGELDLMSVPTLQERLGRVERDGWSTVVLDLKHLNFFDRSGLRVVLETARLLHDRGRRLAVVNAAGIVRTVFDLTGNAELLTPHDQERTSTGPADPQTRPRRGRRDATVDG